MPEVVVTGQARSAIAIDTVQSGPDLAPDPARHRGIRGQAWRTFVAVRKNRLSLAVLHNAAHGDPGCEVDARSALDFPLVTQFRSPL